MSELQHRIVCFNCGGLIRMGPVIPNVRTEHAHMRECIQHLWELIANHERYHPDESEEVRAHREHHQPATPERGGIE